MPRKGQFKKGGGRWGSSSTALVMVKPRRSAPKKKKRARSVSMGRGARRVVTTDINGDGCVDVVTVGGGRGKARRRSGGGAMAGVTAGKIVAGALVLGSVAGTSTGPVGDVVYKWVQKIPGAKTFGGAATAGLVLGGIGKFTKIGGPRVRPWLKVAGIVGLVAAGLKIGEAGTKFAWLGEPMDVDA